MKLKDFNIKNLKTFPYVYVPPCPHCQSAATGRIVPSRRDAEDDWVIVTALKNGEIVEPNSEVNKDTCFCTVCQFTWEATPKTTLLTHAELIEQKKLRNTDKIFENYKQIKENAPKRKEHFKMIKRFIGRV